MIKQILVKNAMFVTALAGAVAITTQASAALTVINRSPGAELVIAVHSPMHVRDLNTGGCKFTARSTTQEVVSCPKVQTFQPGEHEIEISGPNGALCRFAFKYLDTGWDTRISGPCQIALSGKSTVTVTQGP